MQKGKSQGKFVLGLFNLIVLTRREGLNKRNGCYLVQRFPDLRDVSALAELLFIDLPAGLLQEVLAWPPTLL
jgi:hypothetical protein